jgi:hypothetical protein
MIPVPALAPFDAAEHAHLKSGSACSSRGLSGDCGHRGGAPAYGTKALPKPLLEIAVIDHIRLLLSCADRLPLLPSYTKMAAR